MRRRSNVRTPLLTEAHSCIIRAGRAASFTHPIGVASPAGVAGGIGIGTIVRRCHDQHAIAVNVDVGRGGPAPGETHSIYSPYLAPRSLELDCNCLRLHFKRADVDPAVDDAVKTRAALVEERRRSEVRVARINRRASR